MRPKARDRIHLGEQPATSRDRAGRATGASNGSPAQMRRRKPRHDEEQKDRGRPPTANSAQPNLRRPPSSERLAAGGFDGAFWQSHGHFTDTLLAKLEPLVGVGCVKKASRILI
jgi:hypothetical protein